MNYLFSISLAQFLGKPLVITGLILIILGISTLCLAKRITRVARQTNEVDLNDKIYVTFKIIGLLLMLAGLVCISVDVILYIRSK